MKKIFLLLLVTLANFSAKSQDNRQQTPRDSIFIEAQDTMLIESYAKRYNPRKALLYAAIVPGLGQIYNRKYWKLPLVYGGFYLIGRNIVNYNDIYKEYRSHLYYNIENKITAPRVISGRNLTTANLTRIVDRSRRERDFMIILMGGMYILQLIDAHVDAHLKEFDLNPNLKVRVEPTVSQDALIGRQTGVALIFKFN